jgi:hypothetical protein
MRIIRSFLALAAGIVLASGTANAQPETDTWANDLLNVQVLSPNPQTVAFNGNFNVPVTGTNIFGPSFLLLGISDTQVTLGNFGQLPIPVSQSTIVKITDLTARRIENVQVDSTSVVSAPSGLISGDNFLQFDAFDFPGQAIPAGANAFVLDVSFIAGLSETSVPEPGSLVLLGTALLGGLTAARHIRKAA